MTEYDVAIIGAGPAGIMAAISASRNGSRVLLLEKNNLIGRKILATGNGRCNITNRLTKVENYHGASPEFIQTVLASFGQNETIKFFTNLGLILKEEDRGRIFPRTNQASSVVTILKHELEKLNVEIKLKSEVKKIENQDGWKISLADGAIISANKLILTTGGRAAHQFGSSGDGHFWLRNLGHTIVPIYAALVPMETKETWVKDLQGLKAEASVSFLVNEKLVSQKSGDLIFTHYGLSGPAVMSQARFIAPFVGNQSVKVQIDFMPEQSTQELNQIIIKIFASSGNKSAKNALVGLVPAKLISIILQESNINETKKAALIAEEERNKIVKNLKALTLNIKKLRPLKEAQVTRGGVTTEEINATTLESKKFKNLYFAGEIMDVDGDSGGFNLQWAWSSGYLAGISATKN